MQDRVRLTQTVYVTALCTLPWDMCLPLWVGIGGWNLGFGEQTREGLCGDSLKEWEWGSLQLGMFLKKTWTSIEAKSEVLVTQSCLSVCIPMDCSLPGSFVHSILQAFIRTSQVQALGQHLNVPWPEVNRLWENRSHQPSSQENTSANTLINWKLQSHLAQDLDQIIF